jgi:di/tricarboxylate transporter
MTEVVISHNSSLIGNTVKGNNFRAKYDGAVLAIHRNGERIWGHLADVKLKAGDVLLVMAGRNFQKRLIENNTMYQISNFTFEEEPDIKKILTIFGGMIGAIALSALGWVPLFNSLIVLIILSFVTGLARPKDIKKSIDYNLVLIIGLGLALGTAMENSGAANLISDGIGSIAAMGNPVLFFFGVFILVNLLSSIITSKAAVAILIPILLQVTSNMGIPATPVVLLIAFSAAANFITPMGYQTNMMVYGPGRYKFTDFVKVGLPLSLMYMVVCVLSLGYYYNLFQ